MPSGVYKRVKPVWNKGKIGKCFQISIAKKGKKLSKEHKRKLSKAHKKIGAPWLIGRKISKEHTRHLSEARKRSNFNPTSNFGCHAKKGHKPEKLLIKKRINSIIRNNGENYYKKIGLMGIEKQQNMKEPTSIEKIIYNFLKFKGIIFERQKLINNKFLVDAYIPQLNLVIECDGDYWHSLDNVKKRDKAKNAYLTKCGFNLLRLTETEINNNDFIGRIENATVQKQS